MSTRAELDRLFKLLRTATGVDFSAYKAAMVLRRVERRMRLCKLDKLTDYLDRLAAEPSEAAALHGYLLTGVTTFFRDAAIFGPQLRAALAPLVEACIQGNTLRIWVAGCATGQEAYSVAITVLECFGERVPRKAVQIFCTDALDSAITIARAGVYPASIQSELSAQRLQRFFVRHSDGYQVAPAVRELCVFARHELIADPAFSKLDLITCRNVLIYLRPAAQQHVLTKFRQVLRPQGSLLLGMFESINRGSPLFERAGAHDRSYRPRQPGALSTARALPSAAPSPAIGKPCSVPPVAFDVSLEADRLLLTRFVSAAILVDPTLHVIQFRGQTGAFMGPPSGVASLHVFKLVDEALVPALRHGLAAAQKSKRPYRRAGLLMQLQGSVREIDLEIVPLHAPHHAEASCLIVFEGAKRGGAAVRTGPARGADARLVKQLREELAMSRHHLQASLVEQESTNESLRATLEELQSTNEELQVTNEELETGKDELQGSNEALAIAHGEVELRNAELKQLVHDQVNLVEAAAISAALFGPDLRLRRVTAPAAQLLQLTSLDIGKPLSELRLGLEDCDLPTLMASVLAQHAETSTDVRVHGLAQFSLLLRPYRSVDGAVEGVVMTLCDITLLRATQEALRSAEQRLMQLEGERRTSGGFSN